MLAALSDRPPRVRQKSYWVTVPSERFGNIDSCLFYHLNFFQFGFVLRCRGDHPLISRVTVQPVQGDRISPLKVLHLTPYAKRRRRWSAPSRVSLDGFYEPARLVCLNAPRLIKC